MTPGFSVVLLAIDYLQAAVAQDLSSQYCPHSKAVFLTRVLAIFVIFLATASALFFAANATTKRRSRRITLYIVAGGLLLFAIGGAALVLYGLSGCSGAAAEGLIRDWP
jgi:hypothetical protein